MAVRFAIAALAVLVACSSDPDEIETGPERTVTTTTETTATTTRPSTTVTTAAPPTTLAPAPGDFPATAVVATEDGRLLVVDALTGEPERLLMTFSDLREEPPEGGHSFPIDLDLTPDGSTVWFENCCEPASGLVMHVSTDASAPATGVATGYAPTVSPDSSTVAIANYNDGLALFREGALVPVEGDSADGAYYLLTAWVDGDTVAYVRTTNWGADDERSQLLVHDVADADLDDDRLVLEPNEGIDLLVTRRDGSLVWVGRDGLAHVVDPATGDETAEFELGGPVHDVAYDTSGTWLLYVTEDGALRWQGAGRSGTIPGTYEAAAW